MSRFAGCTRFVYNKGIAWNEEQRQADPNFRISYKALSAQLPIWKETHPWLADTYSQCLQQAMKDLSQGYQRLFKCLCCGHMDNADHVAALNILARGLNRVSACGESGGNARTQVNSGRLFETGSGQQQEPIEEITGLAP